MDFDFDKILEEMENDPEWDLSDDMKKMIIARAPWAMIAM